MFAQVRFAVTGWVAGGLATLGVGLVWPAIFPAILRVNHYYGAGPGLPIILLIVLLVASPGALAGGLVGAGVSREGGQREQSIAAAVGGFIGALPFGCGVLWFFTGW